MAHALFNTTFTNNLVTRFSINVNSTGGYDTKRGDTLLVKIPVDSNFDHILQP